MIALNGVCCGLLFIGGLMIGRGEYAFGLAIAILGWIGAAVSFFSEKGIK